MSGVLVVGWGVTGRAVTAVLVADGDRVGVVEDRPGATTGTEVATAGAELLVGADLDRAVAGADEVVVSPGVPAAHPVFAAAARAGTPVVSEIELAWRRRAQGGPVLVAITGTNGKTTVTTLVTDALSGSGLRAVAAGNIGVPLVEALVPGAADVVVAEVSSFQLEHTRAFRPAVSCWLNFAPDHLDWHPDLDHYAAAKARIWANQGGGDTAVVNADDPVVVAAASAVPPGMATVRFSARPGADWSEDDGRLVGPDGTVLLAVADLPRRLPHDRANALAAAAVASAAGATRDGLIAALRRPMGLHHRVELVARAGGVEWYDDSKATTPASVLAAVAGFDSVVLIAGGRNKGLDLSVLAAAVPPVRAVIAIGEAAAEVETALGPLVPTRRAASMAEAVERAGGEARPGDAVVLSPGCASFDWYRSYGERGEDFSAAVRAATRAAAGAGAAVDAGPQGPPRRGSD